MESATFSEIIYRRSHSRDLIDKSSDDLSSDNKWILYIGLKVIGAEKLSIKDGEKAKDFHVTLLYGYFSPRSDEDDTSVRVRSALDSVKGLIPDKLAFDAIKRFKASINSDGKDVIYAQVAEGQLENAHNILLKELKANGILVEQSFDRYRPHMTLKYIEPSEPYPLELIHASGTISRITYGLRQDDSHEYEYTVKKNHPVFEILKADQEKMQIFGWASVARTEDGGEVIDWEGDVILPDELETTAYDYVLHFRDTGERHDPTLRKKGKLIESVIFTKEKQTAMGIPEGIVPEGWWVGFQITDRDTWQKVKSGVYQMFSVDGRGQRRDYVEQIEKSAFARNFSEIIRKHLTLPTDEVRYSCDKKTCSFEEVIQKYNTKHGPDGRFAESNSANGKGGSQSGRSNADYIKAVKNRKTKNNLTVKSISSHAFDRARERKINPKSVADAITKGTVSQSKTHKERSVHQYNGTAAIVEDKKNGTGELVTVIYTGKGKKK